MQPDAYNHPDLYKVGSIIVTDAVTGQEFETVYSYDSFGNMLERTDPNGISTTFIWGYGGLYPVAEIAGATLSQVKSISGLSGIESSPLSGNASSYASSLRALSGAEVTLYEYTPLIGMTKLTTPDGRCTTYSYNGTGKLRFVFNDLHKRVNGYYYSIDNDSPLL